MGTPVAAAARCGKVEQGCPTFMILLVPSRVCQPYGRISDIAILEQGILDCRDYGGAARGLPEDFPIARSKLSVHDSGDE
jgi:hypothetical protein